ncbi:hypothetical protein HG530_010484 [Fusarium avenaceum]|nr:hypothetical protein HG530_010484 [Fusarium avenaceum]
MLLTGWPFPPSRGIKPKVFEIDDHAVTAGATTVSAMPKQYSNGSPVDSDNKYVRPREYTSNNLWRLPDPKHGSDDPSGQRETSNLAAKTTKGVSRWSCDHHDDITVDGKVDINSKGVQPPLFYRSTGNNKEEHGAEAKGQFGHSLDHFAFGGGAVKDGDDSAGDKYDCEEDAGFGDEAAVCEEEDGAEGRIEGDVEDGVLVKESRYNGIVEP